MLARLLVSHAILAIKVRPWMRLARLIRLVKLVRLFSLAGQWVTLARLIATQASQFSLIEKCHLLFKKLFSSFCFIFRFWLRGTKTHFVLMAPKHFGWNMSRKFSRSFYESELWVASRWSSSLPHLTPLPLLLLLWSLTMVALAWWLWWIGC